MIRSSLKIKLLFLIQAFIIFLIISLKSYAGDSKIQKDLVVVGPDNAVVKIKIFSSLTCPH